MVAANDPVDSNNTKVKVMLVRYVARKQTPGLDRKFCNDLLFSVNPSLGPFTQVYALGYQQ